MKIYLLLFALALFVSGCDKAEPPQSKPPNLQPVAFKTEIFQTSDGASSLTFISPEEIELRETKSPVLLCKYSIQNDKMRVVTLGNQQVQYFQKINQGFRTEQGSVYLNAEAFAEAQHQQELAAEARRREETRLAALLAKCREETKVIGEFELFVFTGGKGVDKMWVTDVSVKGHGLKSNPENPLGPEKEFLDTINFSDLLKISSISSTAGYFRLEIEYKFRAENYSDNRTFVVYFTTKREAEKVMNITIDAYNQWRSKFSEISGFSK